MAQYAAGTPMIVGVDATNWKFYANGVFNQCANLIINHYVTLVGYSRGNYWIIQNSWSPQWGEYGFMRLAWGNTCGICD